MIKYIHFTFILLTLTPGSIACGVKDTEQDSSTSCSSDNDCKGERICTSGECVDPMSSSEGTGDTDNTGGSTGNHSSTGDDYDSYCCLDGSFYGCSSYDDAMNCASTLEPGMCTRDASYDSSECSDTGDEEPETDDDNTGEMGGSSLKATGDTCETNDQCEGSVCIVRDDGDILGYCSERCDSFADCPTFWSCEELGNAAGKYCIEN